MNILVIGGTYFLGKAFVELAGEKHRIVLLNRGTRMDALTKGSVESTCDAKTDGSEMTDGLSQAESPRFTYEHIKADRHDLSAVDFSKYSFDVIVDFCAYEEGDIRSMVEAVWGATLSYLHDGVKVAGAEEAQGVQTTKENKKRYIFISTVDVYRRGTGKIIDENGELEERDFGGPAGQYISGKVALEKELREVYFAYGIETVSVRPAFIYGPGNYSGREDMFANWVRSAGQVLYPKDSDGSFQMVFVEDVARAILEIAEKLEVKDSYNIVGNEITTYDSFVEALSYAMNTEIEKVEISVDEINERGIPLPYPLTRMESERYSSNHKGELGLEFVTLKDGLKKSYGV